jgi:ferrochelatase
MKRRAVVLMNLGTPVAPTPAAVRRYLREFLSDPRVVELPRALWYPILYGPILTLRPRQVARKYQVLWDHYGDSPLRLITRQQTAALEALLKQRDGDAAPLVRHAMTYGEPNLTQLVAQLRDNGVEHTLVLPLYPQYSATTTGAISDQIARLLQSSRDIPSISLVKHYCYQPLYIEALAQSIERFWQREGRAERLLFSFHGIPRRNVELGDPYERECLDTAEAVASRLQLSREQWLVSFQSRLGRAEWLKPYTSATLEQWGREKLNSVDVICPAFAADCLETLEEIAVENRDIFRAAGGGEYRYIPCLNDDAKHIELLVALIDQFMPRSI